MEVQVLKKGDTFSISGYKILYEFIEVDGTNLRVINKKEGREVLILKPKDEDIIIKETNV